MIDALSVTCEGNTRFVATDAGPRPLTVRLHCPAGLEAGTDVRLVISTFHSYTRRWTLDGVQVEGGTGRMVVGHDLPQDWTEMTRGGVGPAGGGLVGRPINEIYLCSAQAIGAVEAGAAVVFALGAAVSPHAAIEGALGVKVRLPQTEHFVEVGAAIPLHNAPGPVERLEARCGAAGSDGGRRLVVFATDALLNPVDRYRGVVELDAGGAVAGLPPKIEIGADGRGVVEGIQVAENATPRIEARDGALKAQSGPLKAAGADDAFYFGAIHFHTRLSVDGDRDPEAAYAYARDRLNLDVVAMTDHAPQGPAWRECLRVNEQFNEPGRFVTLPAWESSNAYGHANIYLRTPQADDDTRYWDPEVCPSEVDWGADAVVVPHHPNCGQSVARGTHREAWREGRYWGKYDWSVPCKRARLVEIVQARGCFETDALDEYWGVDLGGQGASVRDALAGGWRLGFVAGTDNHEGHPTQRAGVYVGLTCFRASELTREAIWQAMDRRRTYATTGVPIVADFSVNGVMSGGEGAWQAGGKVRFSAQLHGTAPIERVEVVSGGETIWQAEPGEWDVELERVELPAPVGETAYYYLRLRQADGHRAWLSPVWLGLQD